jgi:Ca-activated chloride channel family protein
MGITHPEYWAWLLGIPVTLAILYMVFRRVSGIIQTWFGEEEYERSWPITKTALRAGAVLLLFLAMLGPHWGTLEDDLPLMSRDIYFLLDVSASMNAQDLPGSRLEYAKKEIKALMEDFRGDNLGLIVFSDFAYLQCPLTRDHEVLELFLDLAKTQQFSQTGTRFRPALAKAMERFQGQADDGVKSRAIVLISDGEDWGDTYASVVERLKRQQIEVYTVGVGTYAGGPVPNLASGGVGFKSHPDGSMAISRLEDEDLKYIAEAFDTDYVRLQEQGDDLRDLRSQLKNLSASLVATQIRNVRQNRYQSFLFLSIMMLFVSMFLMPIRKV